MIEKCIVFSLNRDSSWMTLWIHGVTKSDMGTSNVFLQCKSTAIGELHNNASAYMLRLSVLDSCDGPLMMVLTWHLAQISSCRVTGLLMELAINSTHLSARSCFITSASLCLLFHFLVGRVISLGWTKEEFIWEYEVLYISGKGLDDPSQTWFEALCCLSVIAKTWKYLILYFIYIICNIFIIFFPSNNRAFSQIQPIYLSDTVYLMLGFQKISVHSLGSQSTCVTRPQKSFLYICPNQLSLIQVQMRSWGEGECSKSRPNAESFQWGEQCVLLL